MENQDRSSAAPTPSLSAMLKPPYEPPTITVMSDDDVLTAFQITPAAASWWAPM